MQHENDYVFTNVEKVKAFDDEKFKPTPVFDSGVMRALVACFKPGQFIPVHTPGIDLFLYVIEGEGTIAAGEERLEVKPGDIVAVPKNIARGVLARTEMTILHVVQPPPSDADHEEVHRKLAQGSFE